MNTLAKPTWNLNSTSNEFSSAFHSLAKEWKQESGYLSSAKRMAVLPSYQRIIGMGPAALPLILDELERAPDHWFWALEAITGEDPVSPDHRGDVTMMANDWLIWGRQKGIVGFKNES